MERDEAAGLVSAGGVETKNNFTFSHFLVALVSDTYYDLFIVTIELLQKENQRLKEQLLSSEELLQIAHWRIAQLEKQLYGVSSDKAAEPYSKEQILLSIFPDPGPPPATQNVLLDDSPKKKTSRSSGNRNAQPGVVETVVEVIYPAQRTCPHCGKEKCQIGCEKSERYDYIPAKIIRQIIERPKLACPCGETGVSIAPLPPAPIEKGLAAAGLLSHVVISKYLDHLPLDRQSKQLARLGVYFPVQTLCDWVGHAADLLQPIARLIKEDILAGDYAQVDETPVKLLDPDRPGKAVLGYFWILAVPGADVVFEFHPGRGKEEAQKVLGSFKGYLQRDGYGVYGSVIQGRPDELVAVGCLAHARRYFINAMDDQPEQARWFVEQIGQLYRIERHARTLAMPPPDRLQLRQELAPPIWNAIKERLDLLQPRLLPQSPLGKAANYTLREWEPLQTYLKDGRLEIDNNLIENSIRPSAVGKKNWLFIGHPDAGWRSAVIYSVIASAQRHGIDPWKYLKDIFTRLPGATTSQLRDFLPRHWKELNPVKEQGG